MLYWASDLILPNQWSICLFIKGNLIGVLESQALASYYFPIYPKALIAITKEILSIK